jgi:hypothetical protein
MDADELVRESCYVDLPASEWASEADYCLHDPDEIDWDRIWRAYESRTPLSWKPRLQHVATPYDYLGNRRSGRASRPARRVTRRTTALARGPDRPRPRLALSGRRP